MFPRRPRTVREPLQLTPSQMEAFNQYREELQRDISKLSSETLAFFGEQAENNPAETIKPVFETVVSTRLQTVAILDNIAGTKVSEEQRA